MLFWFSYEEDLAKKLECSRHRVMELEGRSKGRGRRPAFTWRTLVALSYVLDVTLYQLVLPALPDDETGPEINTDPRISLTKSGLPDLPVVDVSRPGEGLRRDSLGLRLFGVPGDLLLQTDNLNKFTGNIARDIDKRRVALTRMNEAMAETIRHFEEMFPDGLLMTITDDPVTGRPKGVITPRKPTDEQEE